MTKYEGFVDLQGTDSLAYTSSALGFMLDNLSKPVVVRGSQMPIGETRSKAVQNLVSAIEVAATKSLIEVLSANLVTPLIEASPHTLDEFSFKLFPATSSIFSRQ